MNIISIKKYFGFNLKKLHPYFTEFAIFTVFLSIYFSFSSRSVVQGDTGEFLAAAAAGGIPHEPGYPLYSLVTRFIFLLNFHETALSINSVSAFFAAISLVFTYKITKILTKDVFASIFSAFILGTFIHFWYYAQVAEIHTLQVLIISIMFFLLISFLQSKKKLYLFLSAFFLGLGIANNHSIVFTIPSILIIIFLVKKSIKLKDFIYSIIFFVGGLSPYIYTFISVTNSPQVNTSGISQISEFLGFFLRTSYGSLRWDVIQKGAPFKYSTFIYYLLELLKYLWLEIPFFIVAVSFIRSWRSKTLPFILAFLLTGPVFYLFLNTTIFSVVQQANASQYFSYSIYFFAIISGIGFSKITQSIGEYSKKLLIGLILVVFMLQFFSNFNKIREDNSFVSEYLSQFQLSQLPDNAVLLVYGDSTYFPASYLQYVKKFRTDVMVVPIGNLTNANFLDMWTVALKSKGLIDYNQKADLQAISKIMSQKEKLYVFPKYQEVEYFFSPCCKLIPYGLLNKSLPAEQEIVAIDVRADNQRLWNKFLSNINLNEYKYQYLRSRETLFYISEHLNQAGVFFAEKNLDDYAVELFRLASTVSSDETSSLVNESVFYLNTNNPDKAIEKLKEANSRNPTDAQVYKKLGLVYLQTNNHTDAYLYLKKYISFKLEDPDNLVITNFLANYENTN